MSTTQYCLTLELNNNPELIRLYEEYHQAGNVWPEVLESIRDSGIEKMQIYRFNTLLVMVLEVNVSFSFERKAYMDQNNAKVQEWERLMEQFQKVDSNCESNGKWQALEQIFSL